MRYQWVNSDNIIQDYKSKRLCQIEHVYTDTIHGQEVQIERWSEVPRIEGVTITARPTVYQSVHGLLLERYKLWGVE